MAKDCFSAIKAALFGDKDVAPTTERLLRDTLSDLEEIKKTAEQNGDSFPRRVGEYLRDQREYNEVQKNILLTNKLRAKEQFSFVFQDAYKDRPGDAIESLLHGGRGVFQASDSSVAYKQHAYKSSYYNNLVSALDESGIGNSVASGELDRDLRRAIRSINESGKVPDNIDERVVSVARAIYGVNRQIFSDMRDAGIPVRYLDSFTGKQYHNRAALIERGFEKWSNDVRSAGLDEKATFGIVAGNRAGEDAMLKSMYEGIIYGKDRDIDAAGIADDLRTVGGGRNEASKLAESRALRFINADAEHQYATQYSKGTLLEGLISNIEKTARTIPLIEKFGTNPEAGLMGLIDRTRQKLRFDGDTVGLKNLDKREESIRNLYANITGAVSVPGVSAGAKLVTAAETMKSLALLGWAGLNTGATNWAVTAATLKSQTGHNFLSSFVEGTSSWIKNLPEATRKETARKAGMFLEDTVAHIMADNMNAVTFGEHAAGIAGKLQRTLFKYNGLEKVTNGAKAAFASVMQTELAEVAHKPLNELFPGMQAGFAKHGIGKAEWGILSKSLENVKEANRTILSVEALRKLPDDVVKQVIKDNNLQLSVEKFKRHTELKFASYMAQNADQSATHTTVKEKALINGGYTKDEWQGQIRSLVGQFKTYPLQIYNVLANIYGSQPDLEALKQGRFIKGKGDIRTMAELGTAMLGLTYVADMLRKTAQGKDFSDPRDVATWVDMAQKSGMAGLGGDFVFGSMRDVGQGLKTLAGPVLGDVPQVLNAAGNVIRGAYNGKGMKEAAKNSDEIVKIARTYAPYQNIPLIKNAYDYIQYDVIQNTLQPGYNDKKALRDYRRSAAARANGETIQNPFKGNGP